MRVDIKHEARDRSFFGKKQDHYVFLDVTFTEEEREILEAGDDYVLVEREDDAPLTLGMLLGNKDKDFRHCRFTSSVAAKVYEEEVMEALKVVKQLVEASSGGLEDKSFEL